MEGKNITTIEQQPENETVNEEIQDQETGPEDSGDQEKKFTQADVDHIIGERLKRSKEQNEKALEEAFAARTSDLDKRESRLSCREYLLDRGYPMDLLDVIDTSNAKDFEAKAEKAFNAVNGRRRTAPPIRSTEPEGLGGPLNKAFDRDTKHKPKYNPYDEYD